MPLGPFSTKQKRSPPLTGRSSLFLLAENSSNVDESEKLSLRPSYYLIFTVVMQAIPAQVLFFFSLPFSATLHQPIP